MLTTLYILLKIFQILNHFIFFFHSHFMQIFVSSSFTICKLFAIVYNAIIWEAWEGTKSVLRFCLMLLQLRYA